MEYRNRLVLSFVAALQVAASVACDRPNCPSGTAEIDGHCRNLDSEGSSTDGNSSTDFGGDAMVTDGDTSGSARAGRDAASTGSAGTNGSAAAGSDTKAGGAAPDGSAAVGGAGAGNGAAASGAAATGAAASSGGSGGAGAGGDGAMSSADCSAETCDNQDNDCDQAIDEDVTRSCGPAMMGACKPGVESCVAGAWTGECVDAVEPGMEVCDVEGVDENCNGTANENCDCTPGMTQPCGMMGGICVQGTQTCDGNGQWSDECAGAVEPETEICDGSKDEDCDRRVDEGCECTNGDTMECGSDIGECATGQKSCSGGKWSSSCQGERRPGTETCDGRDNDCDGDSDEGVLNECGGCARLSNPPGSSCSAGENACRQSGRYECSGREATTCSARARPSSPESCDGADNDCDGDADEGLENDCGGSCRTTLSGTPGAACTIRSGSCSAPGIWECSGSNVRCVAKCWYLCVRGESTAAVRTQDPCGWGGANDPSAACVPENPNCS